MMRTILTATIGFALLLSLSSCSLLRVGPSSSASGGYGFIDATIQPLTDSSGVYYVTSAKPVLQLSIQLQNAMKANATNVRLDVSNVNPEVLDFSELTQHTQIDLAPLNDPKGKPWFSDIEAKVGIIPPKRPYSTQIRYHLCAVAHTEFAGTVCLAPDAQPGSYATTCSPGDQTVQGGQGAPVAVTAIRQADSVSSDTISIDVINRGGGLVFNASKNECSFIDQQDSGIIELKKLELGGIELTDCEGQTRRMGYTQKYQTYTGTTFRCTIDKTKKSTDTEKRIAQLFSSNSTISTSLYAELEYGYHVEAGTQNIIIKQPPK